MRARRAALAIAGGLLLYAGHPPWDVALAGPLALVPLLALARDVAGDRRHRVRAGLRWGVLAGVVFFGPLLWWIRGLDVLAWPLLAGIESLSVAVFVALLAAWGTRPGRGAVAVVWWVGLEGLRSTFPLGGFSWGVLGYTQHDGGLLLPVARTLGVLGVSVVCAALAVAVEEALHRLRAGPRAAAAPALVGVAVLAVCALLTLVPPPAPTGQTVDIAGVQAADIRASSAAGAGRQDIGRIVYVADQVLAATRPLADDPPDVTVWPENSLDADVTDERNTHLRDAVGSALDLLDGGPLLSGMFLTGPRPLTFYNAMVEVTPEGIDEIYRKRHPVPFGEYIPGRALFGWYPALAEYVTTDILPGDSPGLINAGGARIGSAICFENTYPNLVREQVLAGADLLVVSTNNSSYGDSPMSEQHLAFSQLRAVETGRHVLHAGISGISGLVDPDGRVTQRTDMFEQAIVRAGLPLVDGLPPAMRLSHLVGRTAMLLSALALAWLLLNRRAT